MNRLATIALHFLASSSGDNITLLLVCVLVLGSSGRIEHASNVARKETKTAVKFADKSPSKVREESLVYASTEISVVRLF